MTLAELEARSALARERFLNARTELSQATTPPSVLRKGYRLAVAAASKVMPDAARQMSEHTGAAIANMMVGAAGTFLMTQIARLSSTRSEAAPSSVRATSAPGAADVVAARDRVRKPARGSGRAAAVVKSLASLGGAWLVGHLLSRQVKLGSFEQGLIDRYGPQATDFLSLAKREAPKYLIRASGLGDKTAALLIMLSAAATLIKSADSRSSRGNEGIQPAE